MSADEFDFYDALNVPRSATSEEIRGGYLNMSRVFHPDKSVGSNSADAFRNINRAYKILSDPDLRAFYDKYGYEATSMAEMAGGLETEETKTTSTNIVKPDEKLRLLESKVRTMLRTHEELQFQRFLQPSMSLVFGSRILDYSPLYYSWSHSTSSAGVSLHSGKCSVSLLQSCHVQRGGAAVSRVSLVLAVPFGPLINSRTMLHFMGGRWPSLELMLQKQITEKTVLRQTASVADNGVALVTEWVQQLGQNVVGNLGLTVGSSKGMSVELSKKVGGTWWPSARGKIRFNLASDGGINLSAKSKFQVAEGLEVHVGPNLLPALGFEVSVQKDLAPIVEEQKGTFPTYINWSVGITLPDDVILGLKVTRGSFSFHFPIELPAPESKWALVSILAVWTFTPLAIKLANRIGSRVMDKIEQIDKNNATSNHPSAPSETDFGAAESDVIITEAGEKRALEESKSGLVIVRAMYGNVDVTNVLMARVQDSALTLSSTSKRNIVGFRQAAGNPQLTIEYKYGNIFFQREFRDTDLVVLP